MAKLTPLGTLRDLRAQETPVEGRGGHISEANLAATAPH